MTNYAVVIGIDEYANRAWNLNSAVADARKFLEWALTVGGVAPGDVKLLLSPAPRDLPVPARTAEYQAIQDVFDEISAAPIGADDRLYVYFAGHGVAAANLGEGGSPVLVCADVEDITRHRRRLYPLEEMFVRLRSNGPREQFFFIDACRSFVPGQQLIASAGFWTPAPGETPCRQHALYATSAGGRAHAEYGAGTFSRELLDALYGRGPVLDADAEGVNFEVKWSAVAQYVVDRVRTRISRAQAAAAVQEPQSFTRVAAGAAVMRTIAPEAVEGRTLHVAVQPAKARDGCRLQVFRQIPGARVPVAPKPPLKRPLPLPAKISALLPGPYVVEAKATGFATLSERVALWDLERELELTMRPDSMQSGDKQTGLKIVTGRNAELEVSVRDALGVPVEEHARRNDFTLNLEAGTYTIHVRSLSGPTHVETVRIVPGRTTTWRYQPSRLSVAPEVEAMLAAHGLGADAENYIEPSERIGPMPDQTLASLLGLAVLSARFPAAEGLSKLQGLVHLVGSVAYGSARIVVLAGNSEGPLGPVEIHVGRHIPATQPLKKFSAAVQADQAVDPGVYTVRIIHPQGGITSCSVAALSGRISVLIVVAGRVPEVQQYILPGEGGDVSDWEIQGFIRAERIQRRFAQNQVDALSKEEATSLLHSKWVDPLFGAIGGYTLLRRGEAPAYEVASRNMVQYFAGLPDSHVLAALASPDPRERDEHYMHAFDHGVPVVAEGARALMAWATGRGLAIPATLAEAHRALVPGTPWTSWVGSRPRIAITPTGFGPVPPDWGDLAEREEELLRAVNRLRAGTRGPFGVVRPGMRVVASAVDERVAAPGVVIDVDADGFTHDCAPIGEGHVLAIDTCTVVGVHPGAGLRRADTTS